MSPCLDWPEKALAVGLANRSQTLPRVFDAHGATASQPLPCSQSHNIFIGDNLLALRLFRHENLCFHFIYIDPPYNSGQLFTYRDKHGSCVCAENAENAWLSMMAPRLVLARDVLHENGVIFVSIDDREIAALTLLMREIFGPENHIGTLKWKKKRKPSFLDRHLGNVVEYVLVFAKNAKKFPRLLGEPATDTTRPVLNASNGVCTRTLPAGARAMCPDGKYLAGVRRNKTLDANFLSDFEIRNGRLVAQVEVSGRFRVSQELFQKTAFITPKAGLRRIVLAEELTRKHATDNCTEWPTNEDAEQELREIFGGRVFDYPKPVGLLTNLLKMCQFPGEQEIRCLDFFAGSASLSEAVLRMNSESNVPHLFSLVQNQEPISSGGRFSTIAELTVERARFAIRKNHETRPLNIFHLR
jgi:adenine-specific DNA-methyltransferase